MERFLNTTGLRKTAISCCLLMAFLQRIVNGGGRIEREMAVGNGRTDLAVFWKGQIIPIELKMRHDQ